MAALELGDCSLQLVNEMLQRGGIRLQDVGVALRAVLQVELQRHGGLHLVPERSAGQLQTQRLVTHSTKLIAFDHVHDVLCLAN